MVTTTIEAAFKPEISVNSVSTYGEGRVAVVIDDGAVQCRVALTLDEADELIEAIKVARTEAEKAE